MSTIATTYGTLCDYHTGDPIRPATQDEMEASVEKSRTDGGAGVIVIDGRRCYVQI